MKTNIIICLLITFYSLSSAQNKEALQKQVADAYDVFWRGDVMTPSAELEQALKSADKLAPLLEDQADALELLAQRRAIIEAFHYYVVNFYEYTMIIPMPDRYAIGRKLIYQLDQVFPEKKKGDLYAAYLIAKTTLHERLKEYDKCIELSQQSVELSPNWAFAHNNLGNAYFYTGKYEDAEKALSRSIELDDDLLIAYYYLGWIYYRTDRFNLAFQLSEKLLAKEPEYIHTYNLLGGIHSDLKNPKEAADSYKKLIELNPNWVMAYTNAAYDLGNNQQHEEALTMARKAIEVDPFRHLGYMRLGYIYKNQIGNLDSARKYFNQCLVADQQSDDCLLAIGDLYHNQKMYDSAIYYYERAIEVNPYSATAYQDIGESLFLQNKNEESIPYYEKSLELNETLDFSQRRLANIYSNLGQRYKSAACWEKAMQMNPSNTYYVALSAYEYSSIANDLLKEQKIEEAIQWLERGAKFGSSSSRELALAFRYEHGIGVEPDYPLAMQYYKKRVEKIYGMNMCQDGIVRLYESGKIPIDSDSTDYLFWKKMKDKSLKKFTVPCLFSNGNKYPLDVYIRYDYPPGVHPMQWEAQRIKEEFGASIPPEVNASFLKLFQLARKNGVSFPDLCVYALEAADKEERINTIASIKQRLQQSPGIEESLILYADLLPKLEEQLEEKVNNAELTGELADAYCNYTELLIKTNQADAAGKAAKRATELDGRKDCAFKAQAEIKLARFIQDPSEYSIDSLSSSSNVAELQLYLDYFSDQEEWTSAEIISRKIVSVDDSPRRRYELYEIQQKLGKDTFQELFVTDKASQLVKYRNFWASTILKIDQKSYQKRVDGYLLLAQINDALLKLAPGEITYEVQAASHYNSLGWYQLLANDPQGAEKSIKRGLEIYQENTYLYTNMPHVLLLTNQFEEAKELYLEYSNRPFDPEGGYPTYREAFLEDFETFKEAGVLHPDMEKISSLLES